MSGLPARGEESINGVDVREQGNTLRVATNTPHLVSLGTGRLSTAVTLHPIKQGRVTVGSDPTCDIYVVGTGVASVHCRVENSHGVVTLYPVAGSTLVDSTPVDKPTRLSQGSMLTIGRSNYLRFNHPAEAMLMKSVLPSTRRDQITAGYLNVTHTDNSQCYQPKYKDLSQVDQELDTTLKELSRKPPVAPKDEKLTSIMSKVSKFEYYAKQHKNVGRSQFYTNTESEISPKVFSSNSLTVNTPAKDVLGGKTMPNYMKKDQKVVINENNTVDPKSCSYANVAIRNNTKIGDIVKNFDEKLPKKVNNDVINDGLYGKINTDKKKTTEIIDTVDLRNETKYEYSINQVHNDITRSYKDTSFEISRSNQNYDYSRTKQDFRNHVQDHNSRTNQDTNNYMRENELSRSYQGTNHVSRTRESSRSLERNQDDMYRSQARQNDSLRNQDRHNDWSKGQDRQNDASRSQDRHIGGLRSQDRQNDSSRIQDRHNDGSKSQDRHDDGPRSHERLTEVSRNHNIHNEASGTQQKHNDDSRTHDSHPESSKNHDRHREGSVSYERHREASRSQDRCAEYSRSNQEGCRSPSNVGVLPYSPVYANQYEKAESMRVKAYQERVKEEEKKEAEMERLEEILDIFTEYQKQLSTDFRTGIPITPTEKRSHNKIITNGSLPRSVAFNNPNFVKTSDGFYKFETSQTRNELSPSLPRNMSSYENFEPTPSTPEVTIQDNNYENIGRMDEIGIPVYDTPSPYEPIKSPTSPIDKHDQNMGHDSTKIINPMGSPYENVYVNRTVFNSLKPKSPNTNSPRTRIKTTFAHRNLSSPQYFIFPTPPPCDEKPNFNDLSRTNEDQNKNLESSKAEAKTEKIGIEKQLSLEEDIPMIDDELTDDIEFRCSKTTKNDTVNQNDDLKPNQSFDDVKKELMADIPELEAFENDLKNQKREKLIKQYTEDIKTNDIDINSVLDVNIDDLKGRYERLKEERRKLVTEIHEFKCKMTEITSQEDDILRELEMEKALIKGEYDSEIAILKIEQKKKTELVDTAKRIEDEIKMLRERQESRQNEMKDRVEVATLKVERLEKDLKSNSATLEELQNAQDILDNESKIYEDLEFQHLEEESELLSNREDIQNEIILLTKKIEAQKTRILTLKSEANNNLTSALDETKVLHTEYVKHLNRVEELTAKVQSIERELKPIVAKLNEIERAQSPDSAFYTDQTRAKSGEFGYSPQSSDSDDIDTKISNFEVHTKELKDKFNSIDQMSQSMTVDIERRVTENDSPKSKEKKGFWERNFDSLKRKKKPKSPEKVDIMSQSLNENLFYNNEIIENDSAFDRFGSLRLSKKKEKNTGPVKSNSSSKIPTFAALGKIIKKDSFGKKTIDNDDKSRYIKNNKPSDSKYKSKSLSPDKVSEKITEEDEDKIQTAKVMHRKSCGDEPNTKDTRISDSSKIPSQDDIDRISKVTFDAPLLSSDTDVNSLGKRTLDSLMEIERKRFEMLEEQGCQMIENEREKISELKRRAQDETKKLWDQKYREKSVDSDFNSLTDDRRNSGQSIDSKERLSGIESSEIERSINFDQEHEKSADRSNENAFDRSMNERQVSRSNKPEVFDKSDSDQLKFDRSVNFDRANEKFERSVHFNRSMEFDRSGQFDRSINAFDQGVEDSSLIEDGFMGNSTIFEESSGLVSSSIEELQVRNSRTESTEDEKRSDDSRPLSHASDFSRDNILSLSNAPRRSRRGVAPYSESQRPLTRYLPVDRDDFDLRRHVESAGHQIELCPYVTVTSGSCRGYLHKLGAKFHTWSKRWFVFDRETKTFVYYWDKSEKKPRGGAYFQVIEEVYLDHGNTSKSPSPQTTFIVKTRQRRYYLMAPSGEAARIWIDAIFTGAQGYTEYLE